MMKIGNLFSNYLGYLVITIINLFVVPLFLKYLGIEIYGLIGFFGTIQICLLFVDIGITPLVTREVALFSEGKTSKNDFSLFFVNVSLLFFAISLTLFVLMFFFSDWGAQNWLKVENIEIDEVSLYLKIMSASLAVRFFTGLYRATLNGYEQFRVSNFLNVIIIFLRYPILLFGYLHWNLPASVFFKWQLYISILEMILFVSVGNHLIGKIKFEICQKYFIAFYHKHKEFSLNVGVVSSLWLLIYQVDKILMSKWLTLENYALFTFISTYASGVYLLGSIVGNTSFPRLMKIGSDQKNTQFVDLFLNSTLLASVVTFSLAAGLLASGDSLVLFFLKNEQLSILLLQPLAFMSYGSALFVFNIYPYYLQFIQGKMTWHIFGGGILLVCYVVGIYYSAHTNWKFIGHIWFFLNLIYFLTWTLFSLKKSNFEFTQKWLFIIVGNMFFSFIIAITVREMTSLLIDEKFIILKLIINSVVIAFLMILLNLKKILKSIK